MSIVNIKNTKFYDHVKNNNNDSVTALPFYIDSGIEVTESNIKYIVETEMIDYQNKINQVKEFKTDFPIDPDIEKKLTEKLQERIGKNKLDVLFAYVNKENIDEAIDQILNSDEFIDWCVE